MGHVLPILKFRRVAEGEYEPIAVAGTGFTFGVDQLGHTAEEPVAWGEDVVASGYPLPRSIEDPFNRAARFESNAALMKGYVTRLRLDDRPGWRPVRIYELDMLAPPGMSGSPFFRPHPLEVVGVVYREQDTAVPDSKKVISFA